MGNLTGINGPGPFDPSKHEVTVFNPIDAIAAFTDELRAFGMLISGYAAVSDKIQRVKHKDDKKSKKDGWYILYESVGFISGCYGHWKEPYTRITWSSFNQNEMTQSQRDDYARSIEEAKKRQETERKRIQDKVARESKKLWDSLQLAGEDHPYLVRKGVKPFGVRQQGVELVVIPLYNSHGVIRSIQTIDYEGRKLFTTGGEKKGCFYVIPGSLELVLVCEGFSTGASLHMASNATVYMSMDCGNLPLVTKTAKANHPDSKIIVCADTDRFTDGNPGLTKAQEAAHNNGVLLTYPIFHDSDTESSDFNDQHKLFGLDEVKKNLGLNNDIPIYDDKKQESLSVMPPHLYTPPGVLSDIAKYYNDTARKPQPTFAVQTALAILSTILGRRFRTNKKNYPTL